MFFFRYCSQKNCIYNRENKDILSVTSPYVEISQPRIHQQSFYNYTNLINILAI